MRGKLAQTGTTAKAVSGGDQDESSTRGTERSRGRVDADGSEQRVECHRRTAAPRARRKLIDLCQGVVAVGEIDLDGLPASLAVDATGLTRCGVHESGGYRCCRWRRRRTDCSGTAALVPWTPMFSVSSSTTVGPTTRSRSAHGGSHRPPVQAPSSSLRADSPPFRRCRPGGGERRGCRAPFARADHTSGIIDPRPPVRETGGAPWTSASPSFRRPPRVLGQAVGDCLHGGLRFVSTFVSHQGDRYYRSELASKARSDVPEDRLSTSTSQER